MIETHKTKKQLMEELTEARQTIARLEKTETVIKRTDEDLRKSDEQLRLFIEHAPAAIAMFDRNMRYIAYSRRWLSDYGLGDQDITGRTHYEVFPEIPEKWKKIHRRVLAGKIERCEEDPFPRLDGRLDWVRWEVRPWYEYNGEIGGVIMFTEVITDRKQAAVALQEARDYAENLIETANAIVLGLDLEGNVRLSNKAAEKITGYTREELKGRNWFDIVVPRDRYPQVWSEFRQIMSRGLPRNYENPILTKTGEERYIVWQNNKLIEHGRVVGSLSYGIDITERKRAEEALRLANERLHVAQLAAGEGVWDWNVQTGNIEWDQEMFHLFRFDPHRDTVSLEAWAAVLHPDDRGKAVSRIYEALDDHSLLVNEYRIIHPDGQVRWIRALGRGIYDDRGCPVRMIGICLDITMPKQSEEELARYRDRLEDLVQERTTEVEARNRQLEREISERERAEQEKKRLEDHLLQTQRLESVGRFAGGIAHDLNNILYPIVVNSEILLAESKDGTDQHQMLEEVVEAAHRQRDLVKQILSFGRQSKTEPAPVKIVPLLQEALKFIRASLPSTIELKQHIDVHSDLVMGDPTQIHQIIMNLLRNAADALEAQRGTIEIGLNNVHLESSPETKEGEYLELTVSDTGSGMSEEVRERIFDPFFTTKEVGKGTGMGLSFAHGILRSHGGTISVESSPGKGSKFTVHVPLCGEKPQEQARDQGNDLPTEDRREILLVDDEAMILSSIQRVLQHQGHRVKAARDGKEALDLFRRHPDEFKLVITDLTMPQMTGVDLARKLMNIRPDVPIILCTGYGDIINEDEIKSIGIKELLQKPSTAGELEEAVRRTLEH